MELTYEQKKHIYDYGFLKIPGVVPRLMIDHALQTINSSVGKGMNVSDMVKFSTLSFCPDIQHTDAIADIFNKTQIASLCESVIEKGQINPAKGAQVALRFPNPPNTDKPLPKPSAHIDGTYAPNNGVPKGEIHNFTMLVGVYLSDVPKPNSGNFTVWPGTHWKFAEYFRKNGPESLAGGMPKIDDMPEPEQLCGQAGDIFIAHHLCGHTAMPNYSPHVRYALFFRVWRADRNGRVFQREAITDPFYEWAGIRKLFCPEGVREPAAV